MGGQELNLNMITAQGLEHQSKFLVLSLITRRELK